MRWNPMKTIPRILIRPVSTFRGMRDDSPFRAILSFGILFTLFIILSYAWFIEKAYSYGESPFSFSELLFMMPGYARMQLSLLLFLAIFLTEVHISVYILGGRNGLGQTLKAVLYGLTPLLLLGYIEEINLVLSFWSVALIAVGIKELHGISTVRSVVASVVPALLFVVFVFFMFFTFVL
jgi:hypothetical protein